MEAGIVDQAQQVRFLDGYRTPLLAMLVAMAVTLVLTPLVRVLAIRCGAVDDPTRDDRRVHKEPVPRWGGIAIYGGLLITLLAILPFAYPYQPFPPYVVGMLLLGGLVVVVGALDDLYQYHAKVQALFLLVVGVVITFFGHDDRSRVIISGINWPPLGLDSTWISFGVWGVAITAVYIFVISKTMDTIDGIDGLASGIAAIGGVTLSLIAAFSAQPRVAILAAAMAGAALGFLRYNYNPSKIMMGTGGALLLGFVLASLSVVGAMKTAAALAIAVPILVFGVPLFDALQVMIRRKLSGTPITQADKRHIHHQLLARGLTQRQAVWVLYSIALVLCGILIWAISRNG